MGGKGKKRREKNYRESHGGSTRLPPPPDPSSVDALPSKLRKLMDFTGAEKKKPPRSSAEANGGVRKMHHLEEKSSSKISGVKRKTNGDEPAESNVHEKKNKKKKRKTANDLRFESTEDIGDTGSKRKERRKQRLKDRKKKSKATVAQEVFDFPKHEQIKFGEIVDAPPKLVALPKARKMVQEASHERLRLKAVEAYRNRKGWTSRLGIQLPPPVTALPLL